MDHAEAYPQAAPGGCDSTSRSKPVEGSGRRRAARVWQAAASAVAFIGGISAVTTASAGTAAASASTAVTWSTQAAPSPSYPSGSLTSVSCPTSGNCVAVGFYVDSWMSEVPLREIWNGSAW